MLISFSAYFTKMPLTTTFPPPARTTLILTWPVIFHTRYVPFVKFTFVMAPFGIVSASNTTFVLASRI